MQLDHCRTAKTTQQFTEFHKLLRKAIVALIAAVPLFIVSMLEMNHVVPGKNQVIWIIVGIIVFALMWYSGGHFFKAAWTSFKAHSANMNTLIALATGPAWVYSMIISIWPTWVPVAARMVYYDAPVMVIGLLVLGAAIEIRAGEKVSQGIDALKKLLPLTADRIKNGVTEQIPVEKITPGDHVRVFNDAYIPVDGTILENSTQINAAALSGETRLITKNVGDTIYAGTENVGKELMIKALKSPKNSAIQQIITLIKQAQNSKPAISKIADSVAHIFAPAVLIIAFVTLMVWMNVGPHPVIAFMLITFMAVLLIACPCALGLAAPISSSVGISKASQLGIIFHNSNVFTELPKIDVLVLTYLPPDFFDYIKVLNQHKIKVVLLAETEKLPENFDKSLFEYIALDLSPDEKALKLNELMHDHKKIALVSHYSMEKINYPKANNLIKVVMGIESYKIKDMDIAILRESFSGFIEAYWISHATLRNIKQNLSGAFLYNLIGIPIAAGIFYPFVHALVSPILAGALMATSSLAVILNANRLQLFNPKRKLKL